MNIFALIAPGLTTLCLLLTGCITQPAKRAGEQQAKQTQLAALHQLSALEKEVASFARSQPGISDATVRIRPQAAILLLSPTGKRGIDARTIARINQYTCTKTGLSKDHIVMKLRAAKGGVK